MSAEVEKNLKATVEYLSVEIGQRSYLDIDKLNASAGYIEDRLSSCGLKIRRQEFSYEGNTYYNIIGEKEGDEDEAALIIGAHYDTVIGTPGADDNASGVAGLLEIARLSMHMPSKRPLKFAAFCLEEPPHFRTSKMGSFVYAKSLKEQKAKVFGMISLEMIGFYTEKEGSQFYPLPFFRWFYPDKGNFIAFVGNPASKRFTKAMEKAFRNASDLPVESLNAPSVVPGVDFSDHSSFWKMGYHAFMITDTAFYRNPNYHASGDTADTLNYKNMAKLVTGLSKIICTI
jgi:Zn-dependent M28 family amino/carboxypeptidase